MLRWFRALLGLPVDNEDGQDVSADGCGVIREGATDAEVREAVERVEAVESVEDVDD